MGDTERPAMVPVFCSPPACRLPAGFSLVALFGASALVVEDVLQVALVGGDRLAGFL